MQDKFYVKKVEEKIEFWHEERCLLRAQNYNNYFHPYHQNILIVEDRISEEREYQLLCQELKKLFSSIKMTFTTKEKPLLAKILINNEFKLKRRCFEFEKSAHEMKITAFGNVNLSQLSEITDEWIDFIVDDYRRDHEKVSPLSKTISNRMFFKEMADFFEMENSYFYLNKDKRAYFLCSINENKEAEVAYLGGNLSEKMLIEFYQSCFSVLIRQGITRFSFEIDDVNEQAMLLSRLMSFPDNSYDAYVFN